jgi:hypothetical protein
MSENQLCEIEVAFRFSEPKLSWPLLGLISLKFPETYVVRVTIYLENISCGDKLTMYTTLSFVTPLASYADDPSMKMRCPYT